MRKTNFIYIVLLIFGVMLAFPACAELLGESAYFDVSVPYEHMTITDVSYLRADDYVLLEITYTTHNPLSDAALQSLESMSIYLMPNASTTAFPGSLRHHLTEPENGITETLPGAAYIDRSEYQGTASLPEALYLRPYYKQPGDWGDVVVLPLSQAAISPIEDEANLPQPLVTETPGNG